MTAMKSLLLSSASVLVAFGAQAADLPVKAKPVEYVKICNLYGAGFYYIPGTDTASRSADTSALTIPTTLLAGACRTSPGRRDGRPAPTPTTSRRGRAPT
jgi:hypothetical protein